MEYYHPVKFMTARRLSDVIVFFYNNWRFIFIMKIKSMDCFTFKYNVHWEERPLQTEARKTWIEDYAAFGRWFTFC